MRRLFLVAPLAAAALALGCGSGDARPALADPAQADPAQADPAHTDAAPAEAVRESREGGFSVAIPAGWHRADRRLTALVDPVERLVAATYTPRQGSEDCGPLVFGGFEADEALVVVLERGRDPHSEWADFPPRPAHFEYEPGMSSEFSECFGTRRGIPLRDHWFTFTDAGRHFHVLVVIGADAPPGTERDAYGMLDSLRFDPNVKPDWPSSG